MPEAVKSAGVSSISMYVFLLVDSLLPSCPISEGCFGNSGVSSISFSIPYGRAGVKARIKASLTVVRREGCVDEDFKKNKSE